MTQPIEDIQNRVRNHLCPFQTAVDILNAFKDISIEYDQEQLIALISYLKKTDLTTNLQKQIDWFISFGAAMENKIADKSFDVESYMKNLNECKKTK